MFILNVESIQRIGVETLTYRVFRLMNNATDAVRKLPHPTALQHQKIMRCLTCVAKAGQRILARVSSYYIPKRI